MSDMRPEYRERIEKTLRKFVRSGDDVMCIAVFCIQDRICQVCGHFPITWNFLIENLATHEPLIAGSECIRNYESVLRDWGYQPAFVVYPTYLSRFTRWLVEPPDGNPNSVQIHDRFLDRVQVDAQEYLRKRVAKFDQAALFKEVRAKQQAREAKLVKVCPRCASGGKYYCDVDGPKGILLNRYQMHRVCALCQAVIGCPICGDLQKEPSDSPASEVAGEEIPF